MKDNSRVIETLLHCAKYNDPKDFTEKGRLWLKLFRRLPRKYWNRIYDFTIEDGLIDGCKYMLLFQDEYRLADNQSVPVRNITEAIQFIKEAYEI